MVLIARNRVCSTSSASSSMIEKTFAFNFIVDNYLFVVLY